MVVTAEVRRNATLVVVAAGMYLLLQIILSGFARPLGVEEQQVLRSGATPPLWVLRGTMMLMSTAAMLIAFRAWVRPGARVAWAAAAACAVSWGPVFYAVELRPHLLAAFACVAAGGFAFRWLVERERGILVALALSVAGAMALRPLAAAGLVVTLAIVIGVWARTSAGPPLAAVAVGAVVGWPLGGLGALGRFAGRVVPAEVRLPTVEAGLQELLVALQSPFPAAQSETTPLYVALAVLAVLAAGLAIVQLRWAHRRNAALIGLTLALGLFVPPVAINRITAAELLPAYAALTIPFGAGVLAAWDATRRAGFSALTALFFVALAALVAWQLVIAGGAADAADAGRARQVGFSGVNPADGGVGLPVPGGNRDPMRGA